MVAVLEAQLRMDLALELQVFLFSAHVVHKAVVKRKTSLIGNHHPTISHDHSRKRPSRLV
jgi:hypothetical protein